MLECPHSSADLEHFASDEGVGSSNLSGGAIFIPMRSGLISLTQTLILKTVPVFSLAVLMFFVQITNVHAQQNEFVTETLEAEIVEVLTENNITILKIVITSGSSAGQEAEINLGDFQFAQNVSFETGQKILVERAVGPDGEEIYFFSDFVRKSTLYWLFALFVLVALAITGATGIKAIFGLAFSFLIIFKFILPNILSGSSPLLIAILGSFIIAPVTFYLSHGLNRKTSAALIGTFIALLITGILAGIFVNAANITGFAAEESTFLRLATGETINIRGLLLAGIIIGTLGILDDVTVSQAAIVAQLKQANKRLKPGELYFMAMKVGHDHIASAVNTLVLVYTGAALPLLLLFLTAQVNFSTVINYEFIAEEIIRTLVGSIGLILAVPIATLLAVYIVNKDRQHSL
jgi:uncharacterized membrane protein